MHTIQYTITQPDMQNNVQARAQTDIPIQNKNTITHSELGMLVEGMNPAQLRSLTLLFASQGAYSNVVHLPRLKSILKEDFCFHQRSVRDHTVWKIGISAPYHNTLMLAKHIQTYKIRNDIIINTFFFYQKWFPHQGLGTPLSHKIKSEWSQDYTDTTFFSIVSTFFFILNVSGV